MRVFLKASTALTAFGLIAGIGAPAVSAERIQMSLGGYFGGFFVVGSEDDGAGEPGANRRSHGIQREAEVFFKGETTLDNGMKVGVQVELEAETCADQIDETYIYFDGGYGKVILGSENGVGYLMGVTAPNRLQNFALSDPRHRLIRPPADLFTGGNAATAIITRVGQQTSADFEKFTYMTPRIGGFSFGVSYTPEACEEGTGAGFCGGSYAGFALDNTANQFSEIKEAALRYDGKFGDVTVMASAGIANGDNENRTAGFRGDRTDYGFGARLGYMGWTLGAAYRHDDLGLSGSNTDRQDYAVGITYATGPWGFGLNYAHIDHEEGAAGGEDQLDQFQAEVTYALGPGVEVQLGLIHYSFEDNTGLPANENDGTFLVIGTYLAF